MASVQTPSETLKSLSFRTPFVIWAASVSFVLFQFFIQLSSGLVINAVMRNLALSAAQAGFLASAYYYIYTGLQIPVGMLFDQKNSRFLISFNLIVCSIGCIWFSVCERFWTMMIARTMIGTGSAFAFVGAAYILRKHYSQERFGLMIGLSETLSFLVTVFFMVLISVKGGDITWRNLMFSVGSFGLALAALCAYILPNDEPGRQTPRATWHAFVSIARNKIAWLNAFYVCFGFGFVTVFGAMWAIPFIQLKMSCSMKMACILDAMIFLGTGISCPLFGKIESWSNHRRWIMFSSYAVTATLFLFALFVPMESLIAMGALLFAMGLTCGAYMLTFTIANEIAPPGALSTSAGFTNTLAVLAAPIFQPIIGYMLDIHKEAQGTYALSDYQHALLLIPMSLIIGALISFLLPEKKTP